MITDQEAGGYGVAVHYGHFFRYSAFVHFRNIFLMKPHEKSGNRRFSIERKLKSCILMLQDAELLSRSELWVRKWILTVGSSGLGCITSRWITPQHCNLHLISFNRTGRGKIRDLLFSNSVITWNSAYATPRSYDRYVSNLDQFHNFTAKVSVMHISGVARDVKCNRNCFQSSKVFKLSGSLPSFMSMYCQELFTHSLQTVHHLHYKLKPFLRVNELRHLPRPNDKNRALFFKYFFRRTPNQVHYMLLPF
mmetsp:Transcript_11063/g.31314  ORF Transcript_11063/g.31314 Transcript_11063/m.31314 type:complete len:250 (-) Transcript_11063:1549-2298(-)